MINYSSRRRSWLQVLAAAGAFLLLSLLMTWPLARDLGGTVIGWPGDNFYFVWLVGWFQRALLVLGCSPLTAPAFNYPEGWKLAYNETTVAMALLGLPFSALGGPVIGYNIAVLLTFVFSGLGAFLWVRRLTGSPAAGMVAGVIFAFAPYRMSHVYGHFNLMGTQWFPLFFLALDELFTLHLPAPPLPPEERGRAQRDAAWLPFRLVGEGLWVRVIRVGALLGLWFGLIALTSQYYLYMTLLLVAVYVPGYLLLVDRRALARRAAWAGIGVAAVIALPLCALAVYPYLQLSASGELPPRRFEDVRLWSASPTDFLLPSPRQFLWGSWVDANFDRSLWIENTLYVGVVTLVLAALALILRRRAPGGGRVLWIGFLALSAFILALGTDLHWMGQPVIVDVPAPLQHIHPFAKTFIPLPGYALLKWLPFYSSMRIWMRYGIFVTLFMAALAGVGAAWLLRRVGPRRTPWLAAALVALVLVDFSQGSLDVAAADPRPVDRWLAQAAPGPVIQMPATLSTGPQQMLYGLYRNQPFVGGFYAAYTTPQYRRIGPALQGFPDAASLATLRELGVRWVVVDVGQQPDSAGLDRVAAGLGLRLMVTLDGQQVYELLPAKDRP